jgi:SOS-response transcriptional repressor LexA
MKRRETVSENEHLVLMLIRKYISENEGDLPLPGSIIADTPFSTNHLSNILRSLEEKGYIERTDGRLSLTEKAFEYFSRLSERGKSVRPFSILPVPIQVNGQVKAGPTEAEVLVVYETSSGKFIPVPDVNPERKVYALEVIGNSMEHEKIYEGDYVIVEEFSPSNQRIPNSDELAVFMYVPLYVVLENPKAQITDSDYVGPTLKYCKEMKEEKYYRLGWKSGLDSKTEIPITIKAARIRPIGKVIGIYRPFKEGRSLR